MDDFKTEQNRRVSIGGIHCPCCNKYAGKEKPKLNRRARRAIKSKDHKELSATTT